MTIREIIDEVEQLCRKHQVEHLSLFGSYAKGTERPGSDVDFVVYGPADMETLREEAEEIMTLKTIDLFSYEECKNPLLKEDMDKYAVKIY